MFLEETELLNFSNPNIQNLIQNRGWNHKTDKEKILEIYNFVRDEILFGYNTEDEKTASEILEEGIGQCNTKGILFMALLRGVSIPCRFHGFTILKNLQKGAISGIYFHLAPKNIIHSWVEVYYKNKWLNLEGFIVDKVYLKSLQKKFKDCKTDFCGYGVATKNFSSPEIEWKEGDTYIQKEGINQDLGIFNDPDSFFKIYKQNLGIAKKFLFQNFIRNQMNQNVNRVRYENK
ncbi:MAG TPA: transglutaminase family protein [Leptospiraceae bacterium]|nr:transglutaminase family protein [Leptospiraceae bacterium]